MILYFFCHSFILLFFKIIIKFVGLILSHTYTLEI
jgi:hypothetical protein